MLSTIGSIYAKWCYCLCVLVCVGERDRKREKMRVILCVWPKLRTLLGPWCMLISWDIYDHEYLKLWGMEVKASALQVSLLRCLSKFSLPFLYIHVWLNYASSDRNLAQRNSRKQGDWLSGFHVWEGQRGADSSWQCHRSSDIFLHWGWHFCAYSLRFRYSPEARHPPPFLFQLRLFWGGSRLAEPILNSSLSRVMIMVMASMTEEMKKSGWMPRPTSSSLTSSYSIFF